MPLAKLTNKLLLSGPANTEMGTILMDSTFGLFINDTLKLTHHRALLNGIQHRHNISPLDPAPGQSVNVYIVSASDMPIARAQLDYTIDGADPRAGGGAVKTAHFRPVHTQWDNLVWDYITFWQAAIPPQVSGTMVTYCISGWTPDGDIIYADYPDADERTQHAAMLHFKNIPEDATSSPHHRQKPRSSATTLINLVRPHGRGMPSSIISS